MFRNTIVVLIGVISEFLKAGVALGGRYLNSRYVNSSFMRLRYQNRVAEYLEAPPARGS
jgi:hypothetical protein